MTEAKSEEKPFFKKTYNQLHPGDTIRVFNNGFVQFEHIIAKDSKIKSLTVTIEAEEND